MKLVVFGLFALAVLCFWWSPRSDQNAQNAKPDGFLGFVFGVGFVLADLAVIFAYGLFKVIF